MSSASAEALSPGNPLVSVIEQAKRELQLMIDLNPAAMLLVDAGGRITRCNRALLGYLGASAFPLVLHKSLGEVFIGMDGAICARLLGGGDFERVEAEVVVAGGNRRCLQVDAMALHGTAGARVLIVEDVTDIRVAEAEAERSHKKEAVRALIGALMHHLNQRLTVITVRARLLLMGMEAGRLDPTEARAVLEDMIQNAERMASLLQRVYDAEEYEMENYIGDSLKILRIRVGEGE